MTPATLLVSVLGWLDANFDFNTVCILALLIVLLFVIRIVKA